MKVNMMIQRFVMKKFISILVSVMVCLFFTIGCGDDNDHDGE